MNDKKWMIHQNLAFLRKSRQLSLEEVAERVGVSRQAVGKWESGETVPDIVNCDALAKLYNVSVDDLLHYDGGGAETGARPAGQAYLWDRGHGGAGTGSYPQAGQGAVSAQAGKPADGTGGTRPPVTGGWPWWMRTPSWTRPRRLWNSSAPKGGGMRHDGAAG